MGIHHGVVRSRAGVEPVSGAYVDAVVAGYGFMVRTRDMDETAAGDWLRRERVNHFHRPGIFCFRTRDAADRFLARGTPVSPLTAG